MTRLFTALLFLSLATIALAEPACSVSHYKSPNDAETALNAGDVKQAIALYKDMLAKEPADPVLVAGMVLAQIRNNDVAAAEAALGPALAAPPNDARLLVAKGNLDFRQGHISQADQDYTAATRSDPCFSLGYFGEVRIARVNSMGATAERLLKTAHSLDPDRPQIHFAWLASRPPAERVKLLEAELDAMPKDAPEERRTAAQKRIDRLKASLDTPHACRTDFTGPVEVPFAPLMSDPNHFYAYGLEAKVHNHTARLLVDTGASGIYLGRAQAEAMGLKPAGKSFAYGFGDSGPQSGYTAYADTLVIGPLTFHDCRVEVSDRRSVIERDGLIGADVFSQFLVTLDFPDHKLKLAPLPGASAPVQDSDDDDDETSATAPHDRYAGPELKNFTPVYRFGTHLLLPSLVNDKGPFLMMLDTGDGTINITMRTALDAGLHFKEDTVDRFSGISGRTKRIYESGSVTLRFGHAQAKTTDIAIVETESMSRGLGTEIGGFLGFPALRRLAVQIDYRDGMVNLIYDPAKDHHDHRLDGYDNACATQGQCEHDY